MMKKINLRKGVSIIFQTPKKQSFKFGYYNYSPINKDGDKLLAHRIEFEGRMPQKEDFVEIGYFSLPEGHWHKLAVTNAFNWQQGSMLQWLGPEFNNEIIYNDVENNRYIAQIINVNTGKKRKLPKSIYGIDPLGEFSISLNFERCYWTRAYNYAPIVDENWNKRIPVIDGIIKIDLKTGDVKTIISLSDFLKQEDIIDDGITAHWFEHIMMNPSGTRFSFYYRYGNKEKFTTRVYTSDINGENIWKHPAKEGDNFSHLGWIDNENYSLFTYPQTNIGNWYSKDVVKKKNSFIRLFYRKLIKPFFSPKAIELVKGSNYYALTKDMQHVYQHLNKGILSSDGHPGFTKNGRFMLTDTYEDKNNFRNLILYDSQKKKIFILGKFYSTYNSCGWRADLHPRFSHDDKYIIIDSTHNGINQIIVLEANWDFFS